MSNSVNIHIDKQCQGIPDAVVTLMNLSEEINHITLDRLSGGTVNINVEIYITPEDAEKQAEAPQPPKGE